MIRWSPLQLCYLLSVGASLLAPEAVTEERGRSEIWFDDLEGSCRLEGEEAAIILYRLQEALKRGESGVGDLPGRWSEDRQPRIVFLSVTGGSQRASVATGAGEGLAAALRDAARKLVERGLQPAGCRWLKLDVVRERGVRSTLTPGVPLSIERQLEGLAFGADLGLAVLPAEVTSYELVDSRGRWYTSRLALALAARRRVLDEAVSKALKSPAKVWTFLTDTHFTDGHETVPLHRGHRRIDELSPEALLSAARAGGEYLRRSMSPEGRFTYSYLPTRDLAADGYNLVRHAGTVYSMYELLAESPDAELRTAAEQATDYLLRFVKPYGKAADEMSVLLSENRVKLGGVALAIVALAERARLRKDRDHLPVLRRLGRYIVQSQREDGSFIHQRYYPTGRARRDFTSQYYPGEALLALLRLHSIDEQNTWLESADRGAQYLIRVRDRGVPTERLLHDHWLLYALNELHRLRPREEYLQHALRICHTIIAHQTVDTPRIDLAGSYGNPPRSTPAATRSEGLLAAYRLAVDCGRTDDARRMLEAARRGVKFQLRTQLRPEATLHLGDPGAALGGFIRSEAVWEVRIDYVQHNISSFLALRRVLMAQGTRSR